MVGIIFPEKIIDCFLKTKQLYWDGKSQEQSTGVIKEKFKLITAISETGVVLCHVTTTKQQSCSKQTRVQINRDDWIEKISKKTLNGKCWIDSKKPLAMAKDTILNNITENCFKYKACLCDEKFEELHEKMRFIDKSYIKNTISMDKKMMINSIVSGHDIATSILDDYGI